jgi:pimeloyl-ACP methyl ester carboxylesterase
LNFERKALEYNRPQTPQPPFPYRQEEVVFENKEAGIKLAGTITLPEGKGPFPAVVLITGSGPQNRDEEIFHHKPFLLWAHELTKAGFAVLRYDDRGYGASEGNFQTATSVDFAQDAQAAIDFLRKRKDVRKKEISVLGHSEGAMIAVMLAGKKKNVNKSVLLAGPAIVGWELLIDQTVLVSTISQLPPGLITNDSLFQYNIIQAMMLDLDSAERVAEVKRIVSEQYASFGPSQVKRIGTVDQFFNLVYRNYNNPWMAFFLKYDPYSDITKMNTQVLALFGEKDIQVAPGKNAPRMEEALRNAKGVSAFEVKVFTGLNHLFQEAETGLVDEYKSNTQTLSPAVMEDVIRFLKN